MTDNAGVQFERAEYDTAPAPAECAECKQALPGYYYDVNGATVCEKCRYAIESKLTSGSGAGRLLRATAAGVVAAALGALLYYAIAALSGYEFGLIAIVVGFAVGTAVNWGSNGRGGWLYQTLAIVLTYLAIVSTYIPPIINELRTLAPEEEAASSNEAGTDAAPAAGEAAATTDASATGETAAAVEPPSGAAGLVAFATVLMVIAVAAPFLAGFENIIGLVIIGIGLFEAWKLNRRTELTISGPHTLASRAAETAGG